MENLNCPISENAKRCPQNLALIHRPHSWTYRQLDATIQALCRFLEEKGIRENDRVAFVAPSIPQTICLFFALFRLRAIACPLSFRIPQEQLLSYLERLKAAHIVEPATLPLKQEARHPSYDSVTLGRSATFLFTSGSSGTPKIACHSFANHYYNALGVISPLQLEASSRWLLSLPLFHVSGLAILFRSFIRSSTVILDKLNPDILSEGNISHLSLVPTQLYRLLKESTDTLDKLRRTLKCLLLGGAPLARALLEQAIHRSLPIVTTYGMTEMSSIITLSHFNREEGSGKTLGFRSLKLEKDHELWVAGHTLFQGYWDTASERIVRADINGWFATKDLGHLTPSNQLEIIGRKDRQFTCGGENIQPEEIEAALCCLPGIRRACVLPISDPEFGQRPIAFIDDETAEHTVESIRAALSGHLPSFMHPTRLFSFPDNSELKPSLAALKQYFYTANR